jgi:uncharacterized membrane protein
MTYLHCGAGLLIASIALATPAGELRSATSMSDGAALSPPRAGSIAAPVDLFVMRLLEFTLATWQPPAACSFERDSWLRDTEQLLEKLQFLADEECDQITAHACKRVSAYLQSYKAALDTALVIEHVSDVAQIASRLPSSADRIANVVSAGCAVGTGVGGLLGTVVPGFGNALGANAGCVAGGAVTFVVAKRWINDSDEMLKRLDISEATRARLRSITIRLEDERMAVYGALRDEATTRLSLQY